MSVVADSEVASVAWLFTVECLIGPNSPRIAWIKVSIKMFKYRFYLGFSVGAQILYLLSHVCLSTQREGGTYRGWGGATYLGLGGGHLP